MGYQMTDSNHTTIEKHLLHNGYSPNSINAILDKLDSIKKLSDDYIMTNEQEKKRVEDLLNIAVKQNRKEDVAFYLKELVRLENLKNETKSFLSITDNEKRDLETFLRKEIEHTIQVDKEGVVELRDWFGQDLSIINAAKITYARFCSEMTDKEISLLKYLWNHQHSAPFRHASITFRVRCPLFVLRQWQKHQVGCAWLFDMGESSGRYVKLNHGDFMPERWRKQHPSNKQSSYGCLDEESSAKATQILSDLQEHSRTAYKHLRDLGVCKEQARLTNMLTIYTDSQWTGSLQALMHFLLLRTHPDAQYETRMYANAVAEITKVRFPHTMALIEDILRNNVEACQTLNNSIDIKVDE
jgi:thymidylate synthase (FAD)